jgi:hypothetical protein
VHRRKLSDSDRQPCENLGCVVVVYISYWFGCHCVFLCVLYWYFGPLCVLWFVCSCVTGCHLGFFLASSVYRCVRACVALVCMHLLCLLGSYVLWSVQWLDHLLPPVFDGLQGFMCECPQVSCSVVSNWFLCGLIVDVCIVIFCLFFKFFYLFVLETPDDGQRPKTRFV